VVRFNESRPDALINGKAPGPEPLLSDEQRLALFRIVEAGPILAPHGVVRWRLIDLVQWVWDEFGISVSKQTLSRELRDAGYRKLSARPRHHAQDDDAIPAFKKPCSDPRVAPKRHPSRDLVAGRGADRSKERHHAPLGQARHTPISAQGSANEISLHIRCDLYG
jgi:transposase